ncbi:hypothetical protein EV652_12194 [Kribbella steppae]|uniref:Uncharacterized protein n=1 Tax=Kribbella steppae TaxID=2512223 RepID=A0A4R2GX07_9ACTN|nr:hypothetical protein [Kribbella steppae]TCO15721.1 hypothetical protein EV652_12194 [Kribbella steppae]
MTETGSRIQTLPDGVHGDGERLWRAKKGATSTFEEHVAARRLFMDLHRDEFWNPWRLEEQAAELERAQQIMGEWERAEPGFRRRTKRQIEAEIRPCRQPPAVAVPPGRRAPAGAALDWTAVGTAATFCSVYLTMPVHVEVTGDMVTSTGTRIGSEQLMLIVAQRVQARVLAARA